MNTEVQLEQDGYIECEYCFFPTNDFVVDNGGNRICRDGLACVDRKYRRQKDKCYVCGSVVNVVPYGTIYVCVDQCYSSASVYDKESIYDEV